MGRTRRVKIVPENVEPGGEFLLGRKERTMCTRKRAYPEFEAERLVKELGGRTYKCPYCEWWHLTRR